MNKTLYLFKSGTLKRSENTLKLETKTESFYYPIHQIKKIYVFGELSINKRLLQFLNQNKISITFFNYYGNCIGSFVPVYHRTGKILVKQVESYQDVNKRNTIIKELILTQFHNELSLAKYYRKIGVDLSCEIDKMQAIRDEFMSLKMTEQYRDKSLLYEARFKKIYYQTFNKIIEGTGFTFISRSTYPPKNEINALMSFGYSLLYSDCYNALNVSTLLPEISYIHSISKSEDSLKYDLADLFKAAYIDRLIFKMVRLNRISTAHFDYRGSCYLNEEGKKLFVNEYCQFLKKTVNDSRNNKMYSYQQIVDNECFRLMKHIVKDSKYSGFRMGW